MSQSNAAFEPDADRQNADRLNADGRNADGGTIDGHDAASPPPQPPENPGHAVPEGDYAVPEGDYAVPEGGYPVPQDGYPMPEGWYPAPTGELGADAYGPWYPVEPAKPRRRPGLAAAQAFGVLVVVSALGWPLGVLWQAIAPNVPVLVVSDGAVYNDPQPEQFMGGDGWFAVLGLLFGIVVAVITWIFCKQLRGPLGLLVLAVAGTAAAVIAWKVGRQIGVTEYLAGLHSAPEGTHLSKPNDIRVEELGLWPPRLGGVLLIPALGATLTMTIMAAWSSFASLRKDF